MKAEIIAVGTELLLGQIVNSNAQYLSQECAALGIDIYYQTVVGDNAIRLRDALVTAKGRAQLVICTGGLGPTQDDITKDVLAAIMDVHLEIHDYSLDKIVDLYKSRGQFMAESNKRQALIPKGSDPLLNDTGLAVGVGITYEQTHYILLPGPPKEMKPMFESYAKPWIRARMGEELPLFSTMLKFAGIGESGLEHALMDLIDTQVDPTIAPYAKEGEVTIRLSTKANSLQEAEQKMAATKAEIHKRLDQYMYAEVDVTIEEVIFELMKERKLTLSVAESCTGGYLSDLLTSIPGSSSVFAGGIISYTNEIKHRLLNIPKEVLNGPNAPGAISSETAQWMAEQIILQTKTDFGIATTGVAGPGESEGKPVGLVYIAIAQQGKPTQIEKLQLSGSREMIKLKAAKSALLHLWNILK